MAMYCKVSVTEDWETSVGILKEAKIYALPQDVYKNEVHGRVGHTNFGLCKSCDADVPTGPTLPAILTQDETSTEQEME